MTTVEILLGWIVFLLAWILILDLARLGLAIRQQRKFDAQTRDAEEKMDGHMEWHQTFMERLEEAVDADTETEKEVPVVHRYGEKEVEL